MGSLGRLQPHPNRLQPVSAAAGNSETLTLSRCVGLFLLETWRVLGVGGGGGGSLVSSGLPQNQPVGWVAEKIPVSSWLTALRRVPDPRRVQRPPEPPRGCLGPVCSGHRGRVGVFTLFLKRCHNLSQKMFLGFALVALGGAGEPPT